MGAQQEDKIDEYYDFGNYNGEVDYLEVDQEGLMSTGHQTLLMPPGMRIKYYQSV